MCILKNVPVHNTFIIFKLKQQNYKELIFNFICNKIYLNLINKVNIFINFRKFKNYVSLFVKMCFIKIFIYIYTLKNSIIFLRKITNSV